ncbi:MAG TPA: ABC transporter permease [Candidatus Acidoferrum sp.]|nr:ABC transporter permease [Candidatus Acidoferrum sp.]
MSVLRRITNLFHRSKLDEEIEAELRSHIEMRTADNLAAGMSPEGARRDALLRFGNRGVMKERVTAADTHMFLDSVWQDLCFGLRILRKSPGFTTVVLLTLALGIGANTAIFSLINAVALRILPVPNPQQLVLLQWTARHEPETRLFARWAGCPSGSGRSSPVPTACSFSYPMFQQIRSKEDIFSGVSAFIPSAMTLRVDQHAERSSGMYVSGDFFYMLGARAAVGRLLNENDDVSGAEAVIILSYRYWHSELGGDSGLLGKTATINLKPFRIVGISGRDFPDLDPGRPVDFWIPLAAQTLVDPHAPSRTAENSLWLYLLARQKPGVTISRAEAELNSTFVASVTNGPNSPFKAKDAPRIKLYRAAEGLATLRAEYARPLYVLMTAVGLILLLTCANVAGLILARSSARQKEMAVRNALGAPRLRMVRQLLTESAMLSVAGGALGILFAGLTARSLVGFLSANSYFPLRIDVGIDWHVLSFTLAVSIVIGILFGLAPALGDSRVDVAPTLKLSGSHSGTTPRESAHLTNVLVVAQVAISVLVLVGAALLGRTVLNLESADAGFRTENLLVFGVDMTASGLKIDDPRCDKLNEDLQSRFAALPGVSSASYSLQPILSGGVTGSEYNLPGAPSSSALSADVLPVGPGFFETMEIPLLAGRTFRRADFESLAMPKPIVVNKTFARKLFGGGNPLGHLLAEGESQTPDWQIIGVVGDTKYENIRKEAEATAFTPHRYRLSTFELRTKGDPEALASLVREAVRNVNADFLVLRMTTQSKEIDRTIYQERLVAGMSALFGLLALTLACIGLYGLVAFGVARRTHEIGVRMALGAEQHKILWLTSKLGLGLAVTGVLIGLAIAAGTTRYLQSLLYGVRPLDLGTFVGIAILLIGVAGVGCYIPARRAMRVDPMVALRHE